MCWSEGHMTRGNDIVLKCFANGGSPPLSYKWAKISGYTHPYRAGSYHSQHSFHSELSYQESFHSTINQGEREIGPLGPGGASFGASVGCQVKPRNPWGRPFS